MRPFFTEPRKQRWWNPEKSEVYIGRISPTNTQTPHILDRGGYMTTFFHGRAQVMQIWARYLWTDLRAHRRGLTLRVSIAHRPTKSSSAEHVSTIGFKTHWETFDCRIISKRISSTMCNLGSMANFASHLS